MERCSYEDGDHTEHFVIKKDISIGFEEFATKTPKKLAVICNGKSFKITASASDNAHSEASRWTLDTEICVAPNCESPLTFRVTYRTGKKKGLRRFFKIRKNKVVEIKLAYDAIALKFKEQNETSSAKFSVTQETCTVSLEATRSGTNNTFQQNIEDLDDSLEDSKPILPDSFQDIIASCTGDTFVQDIKRLSSILENIPVTENALKAFEGVIKTFEEAHPLAKAVLTTLSIPYKFLKNESEFTQNIKDLAETMHFTCKCVVDVRYHTKIASAKDLLIPIMETLRNAALYVNKYVDKGKIGKFIASQFPGKLEGYAEALIEQKNRFQMAMIIQIARDVDMIASMTSDDFLRKHLFPVKDNEQAKICLEGTRSKILEEIRHWHQNHESTQNILWLVGPPGAGKSTIATTIAKELADKSPFCAKFSCKRDVPDLRDPRRIWPTLAFSLAKKHDGFKAALMLMVDEKKGNLLHESDSVLEQYAKLISSSLDTAQKETRFRSQKSTYPLIIIDALDECHSANDDRDIWDSLLESLTCWSKLCQAGVVKLMVTSRDLIDIRRTLSEVSVRVDLTTGKDASEDSKRDVRAFFDAKFSAITKRFPDLPTEWPNDVMLREITDYAAGLFVWADMVVKYVGLDSGGSDPEKRLEDILGDIDPQTRNQRVANETVRADKVDRLYARIVFEAFLYSNPHERDTSKRILAAVVLAKEPLRKSKITEFLLAGISNPSLKEADRVKRAINSTRRVLAPIIPISNLDADDELRVCHKTVSDFFSSRDRSATAMEFVMYAWNNQNSRERISDPRSMIFDCETENMRLALACVNLIHRHLTSDVESNQQLLKQSGSSLDYATRHWFEHLEDAGTNRAGDLKSLAKAIKVAYRSLKRFSDLDKLLFVEDDVAAMIECIRDTVDFASQCIVRARPRTQSFHQEISEYAKNLDIVRGKFQMAAVEESALESSDTFLRKRLQPSDQAVLDGPCLIGTRTSVLHQARVWLEDADKPNILWILGAPGAGKSAVATTLAEEFSKDDGRLCAKAFAKRDFEDRRDPTRVLHTLAYDVASSGVHIGLKGSILEELFVGSRQATTEYYDIVSKALGDQEYLSVVFIIDALDECFVENDERRWQVLLQALSRWANLPQSLRLVVTSRDIPEIRKALEDISCSINLKADSEDSKKEAKLDMEIFFRARFEEGLRDSGDAHIYWTQADVIRRLIEYAADSFIWAGMVVELVKLNPRSRFEDILDGEEFWGDRNVDGLYGKMLFDVLGPLHAMERKTFQSILTFVVLAKNPLREAEIVDLLQASSSSKALSADETHRVVADVIKDLGSVLHIDKDELLRIPHKSFADFLLDHDRSFMTMKQILPADQDPRSFLVNRKEGRVNFTIACLQLMNGALKFNMCGIESSHTLNDDIRIPEVEGRISTNIKASLIYACRFWGEHLGDCGYDDQKFREWVEPLLKTLLQDHLFYWLEILSFARAVSTSRRTLDIVSNVLEGNCTELAEVAKDALQFVQKFETPIAAATAHIYLSALPFCSPNSLITQIYGPRYPNVLSFVGGPSRQTRWNIASGGDVYKGSVFSVAFFPGGRKLASGSQDGTVRIWDSETGQSLSAPFTRDYRSSVWSVAISIDGSQIASGDGRGSLRVWDSGTGECPLRSINAHSAVVYSVAFSPDGSRIVTGSGDNDVKVWNVATGDLFLGPLKGHANDVTSVAFSIDGFVIASGSKDETIRIWDARSGEPRGEPLTGHNDWVRCIAFSANGCYLASGSSDGTIRLWDTVQNFSPMCTITLEHEVLSVCFSPDNNYMVSGSGDGTLHFWDVRSVRSGVEQIGVAICGHTDYVWSVAFNPNGQSVASGSWDGSVKIWRPPSSPVQPPAANSNEEGDPSLSSESINRNCESWYLDSRGCPVLGDDSFIDENGWMRASQRDGAGVLFWVPEEYRNCVWWPRNTAVFHRDFTSFDFRRFAHGENWTQCRASSETVVI